MSGHRRGDNDQPISFIANIPDGVGECETSQIPSQVEQLEYIADMILELRTMSERAGYSTLTGILDIAYRETQMRRTG